MNKFRYICVLFIIGGVIFYLNITKRSYALGYENYMGDYVLNPEWVTYMELSNAEQEKYNVVPEMYLVNKVRQEERSLFSFRRSLYPEYFNLNELGYVTQPRHQYSLGLCWAFAGVASVESNLLMNGLSIIDNPVMFSERQLDYAGAEGKYIMEGYNPYALPSRLGLGTGGYSNSAFKLFSYGISPVTVDKFGYYNEFKDVKSMKEVFDLDNVEYVVNSYVNLGGISSYNTGEDRVNWIKNIKNHVMNYGAVTISSIGPLFSYAGSCVYRDNNGNNLLNVSGNCNQINVNNEHAMAIIGWDDNYSYKYCRYDTETSSDLTNCENIVEGTGVFILKNSWGDTYPYPYLTYTSQVDAAYGVVDVGVKDWDNNYDYTKNNSSKYEYNLSVVTFDRSKEINENLIKIGMYTNSNRSIDYQIYVDRNNSGVFEKVDEVNISQIGMFTIDVSDIELTQDKFSIKIVSDNGFVDEIMVFTNYVDKNEEIVIDTIIDTGVQYKTNIENFKLYSVTKNVSVGESIEYRFITEDGSDITDKITIKDNVVLNNMVRPKITFDNTLSVGKVIIETRYQDKLYDTNEINIVELINLWDMGTGTKDDPFIINDVDDFLNIYKDIDYMERHFKLGNDLDFSGIDNWNIGGLSGYNAFKGTFDGSGYMVRGLKCNSNLCGLFYALENAVIKNIIFVDFSYEVQEYGYGNLLGIIANNTLFENIIITKSVQINGKGTYMGGLVSIGNNVKINNVLNYANINSEYGYQNGRVSGIINEAYGSKISESYNYGNIFAKESLAGGIVSYLGNDIKDNLGQIINCYNRGNVSTNYIGGGIVGEGYLSLINKTYSIFENNNDNVGNIVGNAYGMVIKNSYYIDGNIGVYNNDKSTLTNVLGLTNDNLRKKESYLEFDFDNDWMINDEYPYLKNFNYKFVQEIVVDNEIIISMNNNYKLEIGFIPNDSNNKNVKILIDNKNIIEINDNFEIFAKNLGETKVKIKAIDGNMALKEFVVKVIDDAINMDNYQVMDEGYLKVSLNSDKEELSDNILVNKQYKVFIDSSNDSNNLATGDKIKIYNSQQELVYEYQVVIPGDVTGTGKINVNDVAKLYQYVRGKIEMGQEYLLAGDVVVDNEYAINDVAKLYQYIKGKIESLD